MRATSRSRIWLLARLPPMRCGYLRSQISLFRLGLFLTLRALRRLRFGCSVVGLRYPGRPIQPCLLLSGLTLALGMGLAHSICLIAVAAALMVWTTWAARLPTASRSRAVTLTVQYWAVRVVC